MITPLQYNNYITNFKDAQDKNSIRCSVDEKWNEDINCHNLYDCRVRISVKGKTTAFSKKNFGKR